MTITAWYMDAEEDDQRLPHRLSDENVPLEKLTELGILSWTGLTGPGSFLHSAFRSFIVTVALFLLFR
jgi:hypothetical protein